MGNRTVLVRSDYNAGDASGPFRNALAGDTIIDQSGYTLLRATTARTELWLDFTSGNDSNSGLSSSSAKLTKAGLDAILPVLAAHELIVHLRGTCTDVDLPFTFVANDTVVIDGGALWTDIITPVTSADIHSASSIGKGGSGWTVDTYVGDIVEITSGACSGQKRLIHTNSATTITPCKDFSGDPGVCNFRITRPTTRITGTTAGLITITHLGGPGTIYLQRVYLSGNKGGVLCRGAGTVSLQCIVSASTLTNCIQTSNCQTFSITGENVQDVSLTPLAVDTNYAVGVGSRSSNMQIGSCRSSLIQNSSSSTYIQFINGNGGIWGKGNRAHGVIFDSQTGDNRVQGAAGYALSTSDAGHAGALNSGLYVTNGSTVYTVDYVTFPSNTSCGMYVNMRGMVIITGATAKLAGAGNTTYGAYCSGLGRLLMVSGTQPTVTGGTADVAIATGATKTWANIEAAQLLQDSNTDCLVREYI